MQQKFAVLSTIRRNVGPGLCSLDGAACDLAESPQERDVRLTRRVGQSRQEHMYLI